MPHNSAEARREYARQYREQNREKIRARDRAWKKANYERIKASNQRYLDTHPEKRKEYAAKYKADGRAKAAQLKHRYGLSTEQITALLEAQNYVCPICGEGFEHRRKYIDHCHSTGKVRGVVHMQCNTLMGLAKDNATILANAAKYLRRHSRRKS